MIRDYTAKRVAELRLAKNVSAREMSLALGMSPNYVNNIENGVIVPSLEVFEYICEYFQVTIKDFFDDGKKNPILIDSLILATQGLQNTQLENLIEMARGLQSLNRTK